jgi:CubicO group peptidase (beta-lactamase class C family)
MSNRGEVQRATPASRSVDSRRLLAFLDDIEASGLELHDLVLWRDGVVVAQGFRWPYRPDRPRMTHSMTKSFTACAIGLLIDEGRLSLDQRVIDFFPEISLPADSLYRQMTVEDLLTMRAGHAEEVSGSIWRGIRTSWVEEFFRIPIVHPPGTEYVYSSAASYMLSAIVTRVTGETLSDYLAPRLFAPLGITDWRWDLGPDGINPGGNGLTMTSLDCMKLGILHARSGVWDGKPILPESWVEAATRSQGAPTYGYHWVVAPHYYAALGQFVQMCAVFPDQGVVLMLNAAIDGSSLIRPHLDRHFPAAFETGASEADDSALADRLRSWADPASLRSEVAKHDRGDLGGRWIAEANSLGIEQLEMDFAEGTVTLALTDAAGRHRAVAGEGRWIEGPSSLPGATLHHGYALPETPTVAGCRWLAPDRLELVLHFVETCFRDTILIAREGDRLRLDRKVNINSGARAWPTLRFRRG